MVYATAAIAFLSFIVWAPSYHVGMPLGGEIYFMFATMLISIPTGVKVLNWVTTMRRGSPPSKPRCCGRSPSWLPPSAVSPA